jgi:hypothetical protein
MQLHQQSKVLSDQEDVIPMSTRRLIDLFSEVSALSFPGVNAGTLAERAEEARRAATRVQEVLETLEKARSELDAAQKDLAEHAERALAYARIYAAEEPVLLEELDTMKLRSEKKTKPRPRRTPKEKKEPQLTLTDSKPSSEAAEDAAASA